MTKLPDLPPNALNSDLGRELAKALRASALAEIADWCRTASGILCDQDKPTRAEQMDMALFSELATMLDAVKGSAA